VRETAAVSFRNYKREIRSHFEDVPRSDSNSIRDAARHELEKLDRTVVQSELIDVYPPAPKPDGSLPCFVYMETSRGGSYVGCDLAVSGRPQTLLVTEMAGRSPKSSSLKRLPEC
jgi:hypothetical protein